MSKSELFDKAEVYFEASKPNSVRLTRRASIDVASQAVDHDLVIIKIEGGTWMSPGFMSRVDCIWDSVGDPPMTKKAATYTNRDAMNFLKTCPEISDAFIITSASYNGRMD